MKKVTIALLFLSFSVYAKNYSGDIKFGSFYETNTFYASEDEVADTAFLLSPHLFYKSKGRYNLEADILGTYTKFFSNSNQDNFTYDLSLKNNLKITNRWRMYVTPMAQLISEPALDKTVNRLERQFLGTTVGLNWFPLDERHQYIWEATYKQENMSQSEYESINNQSIESHLYYKKYFLPETFVYWGLSGEVRQYPNGTKASTLRYKYDSLRIEPGFGLEGRLTRYFKIRSYFAYSFIQYKKEVNYANPTYLLELEEEISPKDFLLFGLENKVQDSYFTNFQINQKVYIGYGRFIGDQLLWLTKAEYLYKTYSRPQRRDDQRFVIETLVEYSMNQNFKLETSLLFDTLSSDAVDPDGPPDPIDPSARYQNIRFGVFAHYLF